MSRKRAVALTAARRYQDAIRDLETAHDLLMRTGDRAGAIRALIEEATAFRHAGLVADAARIVSRAMGPANRTAIMRRWPISICCSRHRRSIAATRQRP